MITFKNFISRFKGSSPKNNSPINDEWFNHKSTFIARKIATPIKYEIATKPGVTKTLEGNVNHEAGHYIVTGPKGEKYPIHPDKFRELYNDHKDGTATPKPIEKQARVADHDGVIKTGRGDLSYSKGKHVIVRHGPDDYGVVDINIFKGTYEHVNPKE